MEAMVAGDDSRAGPPNPHAEADDVRALLLRHRAGDATAFPALVAAYRRPIYSYLARCGVPTADRDDLFQTVFLKIHRAVDQYQPHRPPHPWIFTIVANEVRSDLRRRRVRSLVFTEPVAQEPADPGAGSEREAEARQTVAWLEQEIRRLPLAQREVLILVSLQGLPLAQVAEALAMPENTVKTHLRRARLALAQKLARRQAVPPVEGKR